MFSYRPGFATLEVLISLIIICFTLILIIPAHIANTQKARFFVVVEAGDAMRDAVATCAQFMGDVSKCDSDTSSRGDIASLSVHRGVITVVGKPKTGGYTYQLIPQYNAANDYIIWTTSGSCLQAGVCN